MQRNFFQFTHLAYKIYSMRNLAVESWRQTTGTLVHRICLRGGWIYFKDNVCHTSTDKAAQRAQPFFDFSLGILLCLGTLLKWALDLDEHFSQMDTRPWWAFYLDGCLALMDILPGQALVLDRYLLRWACHLVGHLALIDISSRWAFCLDGHLAFMSILPRWVFYLL